MASPSANNGTTLCRYFVSGCCRQGDRCQFSHDRASRQDLVCKFYLQGSCNYGTACRYDHVRPRKDDKPSGTKNAVPSKKPSSLPKPAQLPKPGLNAGAVEFVPSWKKVQPGSSYSSAAGAIPTERTEKDIPLCPYFEQGSCEKPDCQFIHGMQCDMCSRACLHPFDEEQQRRHFNECLLSHEAAMEEAFAEAKSVDKFCGICMENIREKSLRFGILEGCRHCFCLQCIREWRKNQGFETNVIRSCPECRQHSDYVIPSVLWAEDEDEKKVLIELFKENTGKKQCKYYMDMSAGSCPFGNKCFYKHQLPDGSIDPGESPHVRRKPQLSEFLFRDPVVEDYDFDDDMEDDNSLLLTTIVSVLREMRNLRS